MRTALVEAGGTLRLRDSSVPGVPTDTYKETQMKTISAEKMAIMITMYDRFIPPNHRSDYLPPLSTSAPSTSSAKLPQLLNQQQLFWAHVERESTANAPQKGVMALVTKTTKAGCPLQKQLA